MLIRLLDSDIEDADRVRDPHASFGGWPPAARPNDSSLIAEPTDPYDPLWTIMGRVWPRPPFGTPAPVPGWPYQIGWPGPWYPNANSRGPRLPPIMPLPATPHGGAGAASMRPLPFWLEPPNRSAAAQAPVVPGLDALLAMDDEAESASAPVPRADSAIGWPETGDFSRAPEETPLSDRSDMALAQAGGAPSPTRPSLEYAIDQIERNYRNIPPGWRKQGLTEAATNLEWFLDGSGDTRSSTATMPDALSRSGRARRPSNPRSLVRSLVQVVMQGNYSLLRMANPSYSRATSSCVTLMSGILSGIWQTRKHGILPLRSETRP